MDNHEMIGWLDNEIELAQTKSEPFISSLVCKTWVAALMHVKWNSPLAGYAAATPGGLRWVKASERLPKKRGEYFVRLVHQNDDVDDKPTNDTVDYYPDKGWEIFKDWTVIEWLKETVTPVKEVWNEGNVYNPATGGYYYERSPVKEDENENHIAEYIAKYRYEKYMTSHRIAKRILEILLNIKLSKK